MKKSIGKKVLSLMAVMGIFLILNCVLNLAALSNIAQYNTELKESYNQVISALSSGDSGAVKTAQEQYSYWTEVISGYREPRCLISFL